MNKDIHTQLILGVKSGSHKDFDKLYAIYADLLYGFVLRLTQSPSEARDILQETFLRVWQTREQLSVEMSFKSYLYAIARNLIIDSFRRQMKSVAFEEYISSEAYQNHAENTVERDIDFDEFKRLFEEAKHKLTDRQRQIFELSRESGLPLITIAQQLDLSEKTIKNQLTLIMQTLRKELAHYYSFLFFFFCRFYSIPDTRGER
ncbi:sigma-70 family RNA polymerase sigma factor, partial [Parabacteroides sp. OttesenSCG-928-K15]|nr:sigma-70 family RNA polymerase sigma factor [Parabacteroides sp. OttesenSCG-928-K15]